MDAQASFIAHFGEILQHPQRVAGLSEKPACKTAVFRTPDPTTE